MKIVDLGERQRQKRQAAELDRLEDMARHEKPWLTVELFGHDADGPIRITADASAEELYRGAERLMRAAYSVLSAAYTMEPDAERLPRLSMTLYHGGQIRAHTLFGPGPGGTFTAADWEWVEKCWPKFYEAIQSARGANETAHNLHDDAP